MFLVASTVVPAGVWLARSIVELTLVALDIDHTLAKIPQSSSIRVKAGAIVSTGLKLRACSTRYGALSSDVGTVETRRWMKGLQHYR